MKPSRKKKASKIDEADWNLHRKTIWQLCIKNRMEVNSLVDYMAKTHQFHATKSQYGKQLEDWGMRKNLKDAEWKDLFHILSTLPDGGKHHKVDFYGKLISAKRIAQEKLRRQTTAIATEDLTSKPCPKIPKGMTIHSPPSVQSEICVQQAIVPVSQRTLIDHNTHTRSLLAPHKYAPTYDTIQQRHCISLGGYEPHTWAHNIDWNFLTVLLRRNKEIAKKLDAKKIHLKSMYYSLSQDNNQLINQDPGFLIPRYLLSALLNGIEPSGNITTTQLHHLLRDLPKGVVLELFKKLASPYAGILRERIFTSALDAGDAKVVEVMLHLGLDPCEKICFDSENHTGSHLPLERALYHRRFSVCKAIVSHLCKPCLHPESASIHDLVLRQLLNGYYELFSQHPPLTGTEWGKFVKLIRMSLRRGALFTNECFFVAFHDHDLAKLLLKLDVDGVNGWIKRGLLALRWPDAQHRSSFTKQSETQHVHWILTYILRQQKEFISKDDSVVLAELLRALETAVQKRDPGAIHIIVEACSEIGVEFHCSKPEDSFIDFFRPALEKNWAYTRTLIEEHNSQACFSSLKGEQMVDQGRSKKSREKYYEIVAKAIVAGNGIDFSRIFEQYQNDPGLRRYLHAHENRSDQRLFKIAIERNQTEIVVAIFKGLTFDYPRRFEINWPLAHILQVGSTAAISAIFCHSKLWAAALSSTLDAQPNYLSLEDLMYRVQDASPLRLSGSNAHQQITLRCICYHAIHTSDDLLLQWLANNNLDMDEYGVCLNGEVYRVFFENMQKIAAHSGLMPNTGCGFPVQIFPSMISVAAVQNKVSMIRLLVDLGADGMDSMALARAVQSGANIPTIEALLQVADLESRGRKVRHYGSAALREAIRRRNYGLLRSLARRVDINGMELLPTEMSDPRSAEIISPLGEAILVQDSVAVEILLAEGCNPQALVCYDGFPEEHKRGAHLRRLSPLLAAIDLNNLQIVQTLVGNKAPVTPGPTQGLLRSPIQRAAEVGCFEIVEYLLSQNAPVDDPPFCSGGTPLQLAALSGHEGIAKLLIEKGANTNHPPANGDGRTAFEAAAEWGRVDMMSILVKRGVDLDLEFGDDKESQYHRALRFADRNGQMASKRYAQGLYERFMLARPKVTPVDFWASVGEDQSFGDAFAVGSEGISLPSEELTLADELLENESPGLFSLTEYDPLGGYEMENDMSVLFSLPRNEPESNVPMESEYFKAFEILGDNGDMLL